MKKYRLLFYVLSVTFYSFAAQTLQHNHAYYVDWAVRIADSEMKHNPELWMADFLKKPKWDYTQGLIAKSILQVYSFTEKQAYLDYVTAFADYFIDENGNIKTYKLDSYNIDRVNGGIFLYDLYKYIPKEQYMLAVDLLRSQLQTHPRVAEGGFWHKKVYPHQMWLDGLYMGSPFYARYAYEHNQPELYADVVNQFLVVDKHTCDAKTGLNYHGWDESREQQWANKETGCSPHFWSRSMGWYMMAIVDVLDYLPTDQPHREQLIEILNRVCKGLLKYQDKKTHMWYQVTNLPKREGNYLESSGTTMFCYAMAKGARKGYLPEKFLKVARETFDGLCRYSTQQNADTTVSITRACAVAGLGGKPYRSGTFEYYISEPIRNDDPKVVGPFMLAALELAKATPHFTVATDGSGDFRTVQQAINAVPDFRKARTIIHIKAGVYNEKVIIPASKQMLSLIGDNALTTKITYANSAKTIGSAGEALGTSGSATLYAFSDDLYMENLTIENAAGEVGQAVAAHISGDRNVFENCYFLGNQDTLFTYKEGSRQYYRNCYIEGTTDFIFGWATAVFDGCEIHSKKDSYITAASTTEQTPFGYLFYHCRLTADTGITKVYLGRPWRVYAKTVYMYCDMGAHIRPEGWHNWHKSEAEKTAYYAEYGNTGAGADTAQRVVWSWQLTANQAREYTPENILRGNDDWNPAQIRMVYRRK